MSTAREVLSAYLSEQGLGRGTSPREWYRDPWFRIRIGGRRIPFWPMLGFRRGIVAHDLHHLMTGYGTSLKDEARIAAWELGSGGCGRDVLFWIDRLIVLVPSLALAPRAAKRAFVRGRHSRNLYGRPPDEYLDVDFAEVRAWVLGRTRGPPPSAALDGGPFSVRDRA